MSACLSVRMAGWLSGWPGCCSYIGVLCTALLEGENDTNRWGKEEGEEEEQGMEIYSMGKRGKKTWFFMRCTFNGGGGRNS